MISERNCRVLSDWFNHLWPFNSSKYFYDYISCKTKEEFTILLVVRMLRPINGADSGNGNKLIFKSIPKFIDSIKMGVTYEY